MARGMFHRCGMMPLLGFRIGPWGHMCTVYGPKQAVFGAQVVCGLNLMAALLLLAMALEHFPACHARMSWLCSQPYKAACRPPHTRACFDACKLGQSHMGAACKQSTVSCWCPSKHAVMQNAVINLGHACLKLKQLILAMHAAN